ncbi:hypothetical protein BZL30_6008 [Mycobacterium kansasii]|uniref:Uncharacterized protein n=1 Tax=Mycobacterium kansasii TaxID=1768 RepID=A0A1V3WUX4_MYCKA|nr:hypothetical protein BZL30_6008 [Mycobacterium kansasii]
MHDSPLRPGWLGGAFRRDRVGQHVAAWLTTNGRWRGLGKCHRRHPRNLALPPGSARQLIALLSSTLLVAGRCGAGLSAKLVFGCRARWFRCS